METNHNNGGHTYVVPKCNQFFCCFFIEFILDFKFMITWWSMMGILIFVWTKWNTIFHFDIKYIK